MKKYTLSELKAIITLVRTIHEMRLAGDKHREINAVLDLPDFAPGSSYRIMRSAIARRLVTRWENS